MLTYREQLIIEASKWTSDCESVLNDLVTRRTMIVSLKIGSFFKRLCKRPYNEHGIISP